MYYRNAGNNTFYSAKGRSFGGLESCSEMYPCPFDVQAAVGIHIPGSSKDVRMEVDHPDPDAYMSLF